MAQTAKKIEQSIAVSSRPSVKNAAASSFGLLSLADAAKLLGVHRNTMYRLIQDQSLPAIRLSRGGHWKFLKSDLENWLQDKQARSSI